MKITLFLLLFSACMSTAFAQNDVDKTVEEKARQMQDSVLSRFMREFSYKMPNVKIISVNPLYKGHNNNGFDIYTSQLDKMPILMPDSNYLVLMPVAGMQPSLQSVPPPQNITPDMLYKKPWEPKLYLLPKKKKY